jgi:hypothetical protein
MKIETDLRKFLGQFRKVSLRITLFNLEGAMLSNLHLEN